MPGFGLHRPTLASVPEHRVQVPRQDPPAAIRQYLAQPFRRVDGQCTNFDFLARTQNDEFLGFNPAQKIRVIVEYAFPAKHVGNEVVRKKSQPVEIVEAPEVRPPKRRREIRAGNLRTLVERNLQIAVTLDIAIKRHFGEYLNQGLGPVIRSLYQLRKGSSEPRIHQRAQIAPRSREQIH